MKLFTNRALAAVFAVSLICGSSSIALADRGGNGHGHSANAHANAHAKASVSTHGNSAIHAKSTVHGSSANHANSSSRVNGSIPMASRGNSATAHSCINPAGNTRGWCKSHAGGDFMTGTVTSINGNLATVLLSNGQSVTVDASGLTIGEHITLRGSFQNGVFVPNGQPLSNFGGPFSGASVRGLIISVSGNSIQIAQGLSLITVDASNAAARGAINGVLVPGRTITAYGSWNGSTFVATSIQ